MMQRLFEFLDEPPEPAPKPKPSEAIEARSRALGFDVDECETCAWLVEEAVEYWSAEMGDDFTATALMHIALTHRAAEHPDCYWLGDIYDYDRPPDYGGLPDPLPEGIVPDDFEEGVCDSCDNLYWLAHHWHAAGARCVAVRVLGYVRHALALEHIDCLRDFEQSTDGREEESAECGEVVQVSLF